MLERRGCKIVSMLLLFKIKLYARITAKIQNCFKSEGTIKIRTIIILIAHPQKQDKVRTWEYFLESYWSR